MKHALRIGLALAALTTSACDEGKPPKAGGPCDYEPFSGRCTLLRVESDPISVTAWYRVQQNGQEYPRTWEPEAGRADEVVAHVQASSEVPCNGQRIVRGSCVPWMFEVTLPPMDGGTVPSARE